MVGRDGVRAHRADGRVLSAVADRFGWWGPQHSGSVAWGDFAQYTAYMQSLVPYLTGGILDAVAWAATVVEILLGLMLLAGVLLRWVAWAAMGLQAVFALSMSLFLGWEAPLSASVFSAAAAASLLALALVRAFAFSVDRFVERIRSADAGLSC